MADENEQITDAPNGASLPVPFTPARASRPEQPDEEERTPFVQIGIAVLAAALLIFAAIALTITARAAHARRIEAEVNLHSAAVYAASSLETRIALLMERAQAFAENPSQIDTSHSLLRRLGPTPDPLIDSVRILPAGHADTSIDITDSAAPSTTLIFSKTVDGNGAAIAATLAPNWVEAALGGESGSAIAVLAAGPDGRIAGASGAAKVLAALSTDNRVPMDLFAAAGATMDVSAGGASPRDSAVWRAPDGAPLLVATAELKPGMTMVAATLAAPGLFGWGHRLGPFLLLGGVPAVLGAALLTLLWLQARQLDETERRRRASDDVLNLAVTSAGCGLWDWDVVGGRIFWSGPLLALAGRPSRGTWLTVSESHQLLLPADVPKLERLRDHLEHGARSLDTELRLQTFGGRTIWLHGSLRAWRGDASRIVGMFIDVTRYAETQAETERKAREIFTAIKERDTDVAAAILDAKGTEQIAAALAESERSRVELAELAQRYAAERARAEEASRAKIEFLANMSHELKTPLNAIIGFSEIMTNELYGAIGDERYRGYASDIYEAGRQLAQLIDDILEMSKIEAGRVELMIEDLDLEGLVAECVRLIEPRARDAGVVVDNLVFDPPIAVGDRRATKRILMNLLTNAVKFTPRGGGIVIEAESRADSVTLSVGDTGIGIPEDDLERILAPFEQVEQHSARTHRGTGLGLAISKALSEMQGGSLSIESTQGVGTKVSLVLPRERLDRTELAHAG